MRRVRSQADRVLAGGALAVALLSLGCLRLHPPVETAPAQAPSPWAAADRAALEASPEAEASIGRLASALTGGLPTDEEKVRSIFRWVTAHLKYDVEGFRMGDYGDSAPEAVLHSKRAVCEGYAGLFEAIAREAGFEVAVIGGYAKGVGYSVGSQLPTTFNHSWNAVKVNGRWRLLDCTWGSGALDEMDNYVQGFDPFYFFTPPEQFVYSHFPRDPKWQLLDQPLTEEAFRAQPHLKPAFFRCGLKFSGIASGDFRVAGPRVTIALQAPPDAALKAFLLKGETPVGDGFVRAVPRGDGVDLEVIFPAPGIYALRLFAARGPSATRLDWAADLRITSDQGSGGKPLEKGR